MALSYPLSMPSRGPRRIAYGLNNVTGLQVAPLNGAQTSYDWGVDWLDGEMEWGEMDRATGYDVLGFLNSLNGKVGTFLAGDPLSASPMGTWAGTPLLNGAHAAGAKTLAVDGFSAAATGKRGDWLQFGSGASTRLHQVAADFTANGAGVATIELNNRLFAALADNAPLAVTSTKGLWRLNTNRRSWTLEDVRVGGLVVPFIEARDG